MRWDEQSWGAKYRILTLRIFSLRVLVRKSGNDYTKFCQKLIIYWLIEIVDLIFGFFFDPEDLLKIQGRIRSQRVVLLRVVAFGAAEGRGKGRRLSDGQKSPGPTPARRQLYGTLFTVNYSYTGLSVIPDFAHTGPRISKSRAKTAHTVCFVHSLVFRYTGFLYNGLKIIVPTPVRYKTAIDCRSFFVVNFQYFWKSRVLNGKISNYVRSGFELYRLQIPPLFWIIFSLGEVTKICQFATVFVNLFSTGQIENHLFLLGSFYLSLSEIFSPFLLSGTIFLLLSVSIGLPRVVSVMVDGRRSENWRYFGRLSVPPENWTESKTNNQQNLGRSNWISRNEILFGCCSSYDYDVRLPCFARFPFYCPWPPP